LPGRKTRANRPEKLAKGHKNPTKHRLNGVEGSLRWGGKKKNAKGNVGGRKRSHY